MNTVEVSILDLGWLYADNKMFLDFVSILNSIGEQDIYMTDFVKALLEVFWNQNKMKIFWRVFVPYIMYLAFTLYYTINVVCSREVYERDTRENWETCLGVVGILLVLN